MIASICCDLSRLIIVGLLAIAVILASASRAAGENFATAAAWILSY